MSLLIVLLLAGGLIAWVSERFGEEMPSRVSVATLLLAGGVLWQLAVEVLGTGPDLSG